MQLIRIYHFLLSFYHSNGFKSCGNRFRVDGIVRFKNKHLMVIGDNCKINANSRIECWNQYRDQKFNPRLTLGNNVMMNYNVHIGCVNNITISDNVLIGSNVLITDHSHGSSLEIAIPPYLRPLYSKGPVMIHENVWIGENVSILPGVTIGEGSIIGANTVVSKNVPPKTLVVGAKSIYKSI